MVLLIWDGYIIMLRPVEAVMLRDEDDVKQHRKQAQAELCWVPEYEPPLI